MPSTPGPIAPTPGTPLSVRGLRLTLGGRLVLDGVDLDVRAGEVVAVLGANGSGKSTTLRCIAGLVRADSGSVHVCGQDVTGLTRRDLRGHGWHAAMIFQYGHLVRRRSAFDNVCAGALGRLPLRRSLSPWTFPREVGEEAMACLGQVGLADRAADRVARLSGGQQQRVAVARALRHADRVVGLLAGRVHLDAPSSTLSTAELGVLYPSAGDPVAAGVRP